jgi:MFS family permease
LSDKSDRRRVLAIVSLFAIGTALVIYAFALYNHTLLYLFTFFYGGFAFTLYSLSVAIANDHLGREQVLEASRTLLLLHGIGAAAGPVLAGLLMAPLGPGALPLFFAAVLTPLAFYAVMQIRIRVPVIPFERFKPMTGEISQNLLKMMQRTDMDNNAKQPDDSPK